MHRRLTTWWVLLTVFLLAGIPFDAYASDSDTVDLNTEQRKLNNQAITALNAEPPDPDTAAQLLQAALLMGHKGNLLYLTLGRAHQVAGRCQEAEEAYQEALRAPTVQGVPRAAVIERYDRYRAEMLQTCPGTLHVSCNILDISLRVDEQSFACDESLDLPAGDYILHAGLGSASTEIHFSIESMQRTRLQVVLSAETSNQDEIELSPQDVVSYALGLADDEQKNEFDRRRQAEFEAERRRIVEERSRLEREQINLERERIADEKRRLEEERKRLASGQAGDSQEKATGLTSSRLDMSGDNPMRGWHGQVQVTVPFGGFAVSSQDGFGDGGLLYGVTSAANVGFGFSHFLAAELYAQFNWLAGHPLGLKALQDREEFNDQEIGLSNSRILSELRAWFGFLGPGVFLDHRRQTLIFGDREEFTPTTLAGPSLSVAMQGLYRQEGYVMFTGRWAPIMDGNNGIYTFEISAGSGYAQYSVEYSRLIGDNAATGALRSGEMLFFNIGFRIPYRF